MLVPLWLDHLALKATWIWPSKALHQGFSTRCQSLENIHVETNLLKYVQTEFVWHLCFELGNHFPDCDHLRFIQETIAKRIFEIAKVTFTQNDQIDSILDWKIFRKLHTMQFETQANIG